MGKKRILVVSDTHGAYERMDQVLSSEGPFDGLIHLGDQLSDVYAAKKIGNIPVYTVKGNCDFGSSEKAERLVDLYGAKVLLTHGHLYGVKYSLTRLALSAAEKQVALALYGHTHIPLLECDGLLTLMNPGSLGRPGYGKSPTYGVLEVERGFITPKICAFRSGENG